MSERWLLARPRGGLNDTLCQMEKCWRFAEKTGRRLVFDTRDSGILLDFHEVFEIREGNAGVRPERLTPELVDTLNTLTAFPAETRGNVVNYQSYKDKNDEFFTLPSHTPLKFSLAHDYSEAVFVYEGMGGGVDSFCVLRRLTLKQSIANRVISALRELPDDYVSIHVRQTDMTTDYSSLFRVVDKKNKEHHPVFVASDNDEVLSDARRQFGSENVITLRSNFNKDGQPLHDPQEPMTVDERFERTSFTFTELFALANANTFYFTEVTNRQGISGFSRLAAYLTKRPDLRLSLLGQEVLGIAAKQQEIRHVAAAHRRLLEKIRWARSNCKGQESGHPL